MVRYDSFKKYEIGPKLTKDIARLVGGFFIHCIAVNMKLWWSFYKVVQLHKPSSVGKLYACQKCERIIKIGPYLAKLTQKGCVGLFRLTVLLRHFQSKISTLFVLVLHFSLMHCWSMRTACIFGAVFIMWLSYRLQYVSWPSVCASVRLSRTFA